MDAFERSRGTYCDNSVATRRARVRGARLRRGVVVESARPRTRRPGGNDMIATQSDPETVAKMWRDFIADRSNKTLRNALIEQYLPLVRYHAERVWSRLPDEVDLDDLVSSGIFGLMDAIDAYDPERGVKFETYCVPRIRGAMLDELRSMDWVPRLVRSRARKLSEANKELSNKLGRLPTQEELASHLKMDKSELARVMTDANAVNLVSLN